MCSHNTVSHVDILLHYTAFYLDSQSHSTHTLVHSPWPDVSSSLTHTHTTCCKDSQTILCYSTNNDAMSTCPTMQPAASASHCKFSKHHVLLPKQAVSELSYVHAQAPVPIATCSSQCCMLHICCDIWIEYHRSCL